MLQHDLVKYIPLLLMLTNGSILYFCHSLTL